MDLIYNGWYSFLYLPWTEIGIAFVIFFVIFIFRKIFTRHIFKIIMKIARKSPTSIFTNMLVAFEKPVRFFIGVLGIYLAILYLPIPNEYMGVINTIYRSIVIIVIGWGLFNFSSTTSSLFHRMSHKMEDGADSMIIPFMSKVTRFVIVLLTITVVAYEWDYDINGLIAGLGIGGLAVALAAQETLSNFLGGVIIVTERPFKKGDWIETPTVEGLVEDITFRSTEVRTFADSLVTVPNKTLANEAITNWSEMHVRRISFTVGIEYATPPDKIEKVVKRIEDLLHNHEDVDKEMILVKFSELSDSSYDIFLYFFTKTTAWVEWYEIKQQMNLNVIRILEEEGVNVAFPSRSLYFEKYPEAFFEALDRKENEQNE
ncbi:mechanosensitive ion channel family protein [Salibacterium salarium]|uniref:Mechanosensitive ion channel family protein n=1 Tax=Salibacterium salarium TaxID=284579 RepID=A0A3R9R9S1_9BACI|nr:mechanosensitive ion channel family protein [Salibacterium salarium]RSL30448.1 mechanosensitive ion channel family protein [Salibacterium salarium]